MELLQSFAVALCVGIVSGAACAALGLYIGGKIADLNK